MKKIQNKKIEVNYEKITKELNVYLSEENEKSLNKLGEEIEEFIKNNPVKEDSSLSEFEKKYEELKQMWKKYQSAISETAFNLPLEDFEIKFIMNFLNHDVKITSKNVFIVLKVKENITNALKENNNEIPESIVLKMKIEDVNLLYYSLENYSCNGIENYKFLPFSSIIAKIGAINKRFENITEYANKISKTVTDWTEKIDKLDIEDKKVEEKQEILELN